MPVKKYVRPEKRKLLKAETRLQAYILAFSHWYQIGKTLATPCKQCGLPMSDPIHKDNGVSNASL